MSDRSRPTLILALALGALTSLALTGLVLAAETRLTADLAGTADTDADGSGTATVVLDPDAGSACWTLSVADIDPVTVSHIHVGAAGANGGVVVDLDLDGFEGSSEGCNDAADKASLEAIIANPAGYYVNVHNEAYPGGAIRGQLTPESPNTALPADEAPLVPIGLLAVAAAIGVGMRRARASVVGA
jgi:hypothetical protein